MIVIYIYVLLHIFSIVAYHRILNVVPCAIQWGWHLFIHSLYNSIHLLIPNSKSVALPYPLPGNHKTVIYVCESVSVS